MAECHAQLVKWYCDDGQIIHTGEPMFELETDKANVDVPASLDGVLRQLAKVGDVVHQFSDVVRIDPIE